MQEHTPSVDIHWQKIQSKQKSEPIQPNEYEEWRHNPVTLRLFSDLEEIMHNNSEYFTSASFDSPSACSLAQREVFGQKQTTEFVFGWSPQEVVMGVEQ